MNQVLEGDRLTVKIEGKGAKGDWKAKAQSGLIIFIKDTGAIEEGEIVDIIVTAVKPTCAFAKLA